jgi:hypothetical protein
MRFPYCMTYCGAIVHQYDWYRQLVAPDLPAIPSIGLAGCP